MSRSIQLCVLAGGMTLADLVVFIHCVPIVCQAWGSTHADISGYVGVKFNEIQLADGPKEKIDAVGKALDMGPIKGTVTGKNTGKNFAIRAASGIGSVAAMLIGNNTSSSFSEQDLLRERIAQNIGNAGDSELLGLNANSRVTVSVAAETQIYVVFTKHEQTPSTLRKVAYAAEL